MEVGSEDWVALKTLNQNSDREIMRMNGESLVEPKLRPIDTMGVSENSRRSAFMTMQESVSLASELGEGLRALKPEIIVGIPNGALLIAKVIVDQLYLSLHNLLIRRRGNHLKGIYN